jgi:Restriction endonuclease
MIEFIFIFSTAIFITVFIKKNQNGLNPQKSDFTRFQKEKNYINVSEVAKHYEVSPQEMNKVFETMNLIDRKDRWITITPLGIKYGGKELYDSRRKLKYVVWEEKVKDLIEIKKEVANIKNIEISKETNLYEVFKESNNTSKKKMTRSEKEIKGQKYEEYIARFFREQGYYVWEHGKEKGKNDGGIDLFIKKEKFVYFVQCKDWESWKVDDKTVKATQTDVRNYMLENPELTNLLSGCTKKILYVTSKAALTKGAYRYIKENEDIFEHQVIPGSG